MTRDAGKVIAAIAAVALVAALPAGAQRGGSAAPGALEVEGASEGQAPTETALTLSRRGLELLESGQHRAAAGALQEALESDDGSLEIGSAREVTRYNLALAQARAGELPAAAEALQELEAGEVDPELRARARFNRGHALFTEAQALAESDAAGAIERYLQAAEAFRLAAAMGTEEAPRAARNVEICRLAAKRLRDRLQQEQKRQQQAQQMADELRDLAERQEQLSEESQARAQSEQPTDDLQQQQEELRQEAEEALQKMREMAEQSQSEQREAEQTPEEGAADDIERATEAQDEASQELREQRPEDAAEDQQRAADLLRQAAERLGAGQRQQDGQQEQQEEGAEASESQQQGEQEGEGEQRDAIAEYLLDKERAEREAREHIRGRLGRIVPVEKDW